MTVSAKSQKSLQEVARSRLRRQNQSGKCWPVKSRSGLPCKRSPLFRPQSTIASAASQEYLPSSGSISSQENGKHTELNVSSSQGFLGREDAASRQPSAVSRVGCRSCRS